MKQILVPTDFSKTASNAAIYAACLAKDTGAKLTLLHSYNMPVPIAEAPVIIMSPEELEKLCQEKLDMLKKEIQEKCGVTTECILTLGFAVEEIEIKAREIKADLVVMGMKDSGRIAEFIIGSTATGVMGKAKQPVMIIPDGAEYRRLEKIVFACDYKEVSSGSYLNIVKDIATLFNSKVFIVNLVNPSEEINVDTATEGMKLEMNFGEINHSFYFPKGEDVVDGITAFMEIHGADLVVMMHHKHNMVYRIFHESKTKRMAFHTHVPLLNLADKNG